MTTPTTPPPAPSTTSTETAPAPAQSTGFGITSLVLGCVGVLFFWLYAIVPVLAIIFGGIDIKRAKDAGRKPSGLAIAGLVLGIVFGVIGLLVVVAMIADGNSANGGW